MNPNPNRAIAKLGMKRLSVSIDGDWCSEQRWYTPDLPIFLATDGSEIDVRDDGSILYETPDGAVQEIEEPDSITEEVAIYTPLNIYPADRIKVHTLETTKDE